MNIIKILNGYLDPVDRFILLARRYIGYIILLLAGASLYYLTDTSFMKESGEKAILVLWIILWMPILSRVLGIRIFQTLLPLRKELGILMGVLAIVHGSTYIIPHPEVILTRDFWITADGYPSYLAFGYLSMILTVPLLVTSSSWIMRHMGKYWKMLHRLVYIILIFSVAHVVLLKLYLHFEVAPVVLLVVYFIAKSFEWSGCSFAEKLTSKSYSKGQKWLCVPCGYIYDPVIGDEDSGVAPGTEFIDIPDDWACPVCGVKKSDFIPVGEETQSVLYDATIVGKEFLNPTTLELSIETRETLESQPGQFVSFLWHDDIGDFIRSYSIISREGNIFVFTIKLTDLGRGARLLRDIAIGTDIRVRGVFGSFFLHNTDHPKVFIATGTGLAPIYNMIRSLPADMKKTLYFTVATGAELFYLEKLQKIENLDTHIHVTKEEVAGCNFGRVDVDQIHAEDDTEWYLCGNPRMLTEAREKLQKRGFTSVYSEEFN